MATNFDPYKAWLGIPDGVRPPNHYQLLGLELFESEPPVIAEAAEERTERVRGLAVGPQAEIGRRLLEELMAARKVLLSAATRRAYDVELRQKLGMPPPKGAPAPVARAAPAAIPAAAVPAAAKPVAGKPAAATPVAQAAVPRAAVPVAAVPVQSRAASAVAQAVPVAGAARTVASAIPNLALDDVESEPAYRPRRFAPAIVWRQLGLAGHRVSRTGGLGQPFVSFTKTGSWPHWKIDLRRRKSLCQRLDAQRRGTRAES